MGILYPKKVERDFLPSAGAEVAQLVEHVLGKDEVVGSIPIFS